MKRDKLTLEQAKEKFGKDNVRKIFEIKIRDEMHPVYSIDGYEHELGKQNGHPDTWWLYYPKYEETLIPYLDEFVHRVCWGIQCEEYNSAKVKWDEFSITWGLTCKITANGRVVFTFNHREISSALTKAQNLIEKMSHHPYDFVNYETEKGRKIWYYGLPATIEPKLDPGEIMIVPDYSYMNSDEWWSELERRKTNVTSSSVMNDFQRQELEIEKDSFEESKDYGMINHGSVFYDGMIKWFRE